MAELDEAMKEYLFMRMPLLRFEEWGVYVVPGGFAWSKGGYPDSFN